MEQGEYLQGDALLRKMESLFKACADQTRLRILHLLAQEGEICVCYFVEVLKTNQPKVSRHLAYLKRVGLVTDRKDGLWVYYRLASPLAAPAARIMACLQECSEAVAVMQEDVQTLRAIQPTASLARSVQASRRSIEVVSRKAEPEVAAEIQIELL